MSLEQPALSRQDDAPGADRPERATIRFQRPQLPPAQDVERYFALAREERWFSNRGPCHRLLSERLERFLGGEVEVVPVANATLGLMLASRCLIGESPSGSLAIVPSFTFPATAQAAVWNGLRPVWCDVEPDGWHLDPDALGAALRRHGSQVALVIACSTFGTAPDPAHRTAWREACERAGVPLLVDSAAGFGTVDERGERLGGSGDAEVFSFHATKPFGIGEGGAIATRRPELARRLTAMANFSFDERHAVASAFGLNAKMSEHHAATGLALLDRFEGILERRRSLAESLRGPLESHGYVFQASASGSAWQFVPVLAPSAEVRASVLAQAPAHGVEVRTYHEPLHSMPPFAAVAAEESDLPVTTALASRSLSLPLANDLSPQELERVAELLTGCIGSPPSR